MTKPVLSPRKDHRGGERRGWGGKPDFLGGPSFSVSDLRMTALLREPRMPSFYLHATPHGWWVTREGTGMHSL